MTQTADPLLADRALARPVGLAALVFSVIYFVSDLIELAQGGFSPLQLALTDAGEAAIPLFVLGLYAVQRRDGCRGAAPVPREMTAPSPSSTPSASAGP